METEEYPAIFIPFGDWVMIAILTVVFAVAAVGNFCVLVSILRTLSRRPSPMHKLLLHLCVADVIVVFTLIPSEIVWRVAGHWYAGNLVCKVVQFVRAFGLNLSATVLICVSVDRYYVVIHPLQILNSQRRVKIMLVLSWLVAALCALPQSIIFRLETRREDGYVWRQCLSIWVGPTVELANTLLHIGIQYLIPLVVIVFSYGGILFKIHKASSATSTDEMEDTFLRRTGTTCIDRAKMKTIRLTSVIVAAFIICWTPYAVIALWSVIDQESVKTMMNYYFRDILFQMVLANSCVNPLLYGIYGRSSSPAPTASVTTQAVELGPANSFISRPIRDLGVQRKR